jgi:hypothetical protein
MTLLNDTLFEVLKNQFILVLPSTRHIKHSSLYSTPVPLCTMVPALTLLKAMHFELCNLCMSNMIPKVQEWSQHCILC